MRDRSDGSGGIEERQLWLRCRELWSNDGEMVSLASVDDDDVGQEMQNLVDLKMNWTLPPLLLLRPRSSSEYESNSLFQDKSYFTN